MLGKKTKMMCTHKVIENYQKFPTGYVNIILSLCFKKNKEICVLFLRVLGKNPIFKNID